jgi:hypothetical protein
MRLDAGGYKRTARPFQQQPHLVRSVAAREIISRLANL